MHLNGRLQLCTHKFTFAPRLRHPARARDLCESLRSEHIKFLSCYLDNLCAGNSIIKYFASTTCVRCFAENRCRQHTHRTRIVSPIPTAAHLKNITVPGASGRSRLFTGTASCEAMRACVCAVSYWLKLFDIFNGQISGWMCKRFRAHTCDVRTREMTRC